MPFPQVLSECCVRSVKRKSTEGKKGERDSGKGLEKLDAGHILMLT